MNNYSPNTDILQIMESMSTDSDNEGMELVEDQAAINHRQELTG